MTDRLAYTLPADPAATLPEAPSRSILDEARFTGFALTERGQSHIDRGLPGQDSHFLRYLPAADLVIAVISDGVGSCALSHWGSYIAADAALNHAAEQILGHCGEQPYALTEDHFLYDCLLESFRAARRAIEDAAAAAGVPERSMHCTLTLALYDGSALWYCHAGDDGIVVQFEDGFVKQVTGRQKGEEASSVYPLQSGEGSWQVGKVASKAHGAAVAFAMATDGVLDAFSFEEELYKETEGCCMGVYYPFIKNAFYDGAGHPAEPKAALSAYERLMLDPSYRSRVTDDLTLLTVVYPPALIKGTVPAFSMSAWNEAGAELLRRRREALYGGAKPGPKAAAAEESPAGTAPQQNHFPRAGSTPQQTPNSLRDHTVSTGPQAGSAQPGAVPQQTGTAQLQYGAAGTAPAGTAPETAASKRSVFRTDGGIPPNPSSAPAQQRQHASPRPSTPFLSGLSFGAAAVLLALFLLIAVRSCAARRRTPTAPVPPPLQTAQPPAAEDPARSNTAEPAPETAPTPTPTAAPEITPEPAMTSQPTMQSTPIPEPAEAPEASAMPETAPTPEGEDPAAADAPIPGREENTAPEPSTLPKLADITEGQPEKI